MLTRISTIIMEQSNDNSIWDVWFVYDWVYMREMFAVSNDQAVIEGLFSTERETIMATIKPVGELVEALKAYDPKLPVGLYIYEAEEGGAYVKAIKLQKADDRNTLLYHKGVHPMDIEEEIKEMLTLCTDIG